MITLALSRRIFTETLPFLAAAGIYPLEDPETSRKLIIGTNNPDLRIVVVRASDVPTYVQYGAADMGVPARTPCTNTAAPVFMYLWTSISPNAACA